MSLRIAYVGAGSFTSRHMFPQFGQHDLALAAVCDLVEEKARTAQQRYGFKAAYTDFREMLETEKPDAVFCVGGPKVHYEVGMEVLARGFPLYIQKPPAPSSAATKEMADLAAKKGLVCHVGFNFRSAPAVQQARAILKGDEFGQPLMGILRYGLCSGPTIAHAVTDQHCHLVNLAQFLMGEMTVVSVVRSTLPDARDYVMSVQFESGAVGTLNFTSGQIIGKEFVYFEVTGDGTFLYSHEGGELVWRRPASGPWWQCPEADHVFRRGWYGHQIGLEALGYTGDVANFVAAVKGEAEDVSPVSSSVTTMAVCEEILRQVAV